MKSNVTGSKHHNSAAVHPIGSDAKAIHPFFVKSPTYLHLSQGVKAADDEDKKKKELMSRNIATLEVLPPSQCRQPPVHQEAKMSESQDFANKGLAPQQAPMPEVNDIGQVPIPPLSFSSKNHMPPSAQTQADSPPIISESSNTNSTSIVRTIVRRLSIGKGDNSAPSPKHHESSETPNNNNSNNNSSIVQTMIRRLSIGKSSGNSGEQGTLPLSNGTLQYGSTSRQSLRPMIKKKESYKKESLMKQQIQMIPDAPDRMNLGSQGRTNGLTLLGLNNRTNILIASKLKKQAQNVRSKRRGSKHRKEMDLIGIHNRHKKVLHQYSIRVVQTEEEASPEIILKGHQKFLILPTYQWYKGWQLVRRADMDECLYIYIFFSMILDYAGHYYLSKHRCAL